MHDDPQSPPPSERDPLPKIWDEKSTIGEMLRGRRGLIVGVANEQSIAFGCAAKLRGFGAEVALTYLNDKAKPYVEPLASQIGASMLLPLDVRDVDAIPRLFEQIKHEWA
ncbi:MAG: SDR family oxidoreductase, partial [Betaproteobacteria bacterium]|nr:SDR family oxidoreductase [Betaproteobacteria bacterium]